MVSPKNSIIYEILNVARYDKIAIRKTANITSVPFMIRPTSDKGKW